MRTGLALVLLLALPAVAEAKLTVVRADGTRVAFAPRVSVSCGIENDAAVVRVVGGAPGRRGAAYWTVQVARASLGGFNRPLGFARFNAGIPLVFAYDAPRDNELSSSEEEARGRLLVHSGGCAPRPHLTFSVYGRLGSEIANRSGGLAYGSVRARGPRIG